MGWTDAQVFQAACAKPILLGFDPATLATKLAGLMDIFGANNSDMLKQRLPYFPSLLYGNTAELRAKLAVVQVALQLPTLDGAREVVLKQLNVLGFSAKTVRDGVQRLQHALGCDEAMASQLVTSDAKLLGLELQNKVKVLRAVAATGRSGWDWRQWPVSNLANSLTYSPERFIRLLWLHHESERLGQAGAGGGVDVSMQLEGLQALMRYGAVRGLAKPSEQKWEQLLADRGLSASNCSAWIRQYMLNHGLTSRKTRQRDTAAAPQPTSDPATQHAAVQAALDALALKHGQVSPAAVGYPRLMQHQRADDGLQQVLEQGLNSIMQATGVDLAYAAGMAEAHRKLLTKNGAALALSWELLRRTAQLLGKDLTSDFKPGSLATLLILAHVRLSRVLALHDALIARGVATAGRGVKLPALYPAMRLTDSQWDDKYPHCPSSAVQAWSDANLLHLQQQLAAQ